MYITCLGQRSTHTNYSIKSSYGDFPGSSVVKTSPSNAGGTGLIPGWGAKIPHALQPKNQNIKNKSNIVTNSMKTLKMVHIKKIFKKRAVIENQTSLF